MNPPETSSVARPAPRAASSSGPGARREAQPLAVDALEDGRVEPGERRHAAPQALRPVDLPAHRGRGHRGHLGLASREIGDLVDALHGDERGVHVERQQAEVREPAAVLHEAPVERGARRSAPATASRVAGSASRTRKASPVMRSIADPRARTQSAFRSGVAMSAPWTTRWKAVMAWPARS